ncbi:MAG: ATP-binding protein, partial [bacterium]
AVFKAKDGRKVAVEGSLNAQMKDGNFVMARGIFRDVTDREKLEKELLKMDLLSVLGVFAGGLAHDFNNLLTAVMGNIEMAKIKSGSAPGVMKMLENAELACCRAKDLAGQLLTFARGGAPVKTTVKVEQLLNASARLALSGSNIKPEFKIPADIWCVYADQGQIIQAFNNMLLNAREAMPAGGIISIKADNWAEESQGYKDLPVSPGKYVSIRIEDEGAGIPESHIARIFDPYFTTKQHGSGLGLSVVFSVIKKHDGHVTVESVPGKGSSFTVYLPASPEKSYPEGGGSDETMVKGRGRILIMDDEAAVRKVACRILQECGYDVDFAGDGDEAISKYLAARKTGGGFDAVIADLTVPGGLGGEQMGKKLLALDPEARIIVSSAYSDSPVMANYPSYGFSGVLPKPYSISELSRVVNDVLKKRSR